MRRFSIFSLIALSGTMLLSCSGNNSQKQADTGAGKAKGDTSIVSHGRADAPHDSISGDPYSKGAEDPNAKLPKK